MKYYHLVTRIPMYEGQIIDFSGDAAFLPQINGDSFEKKIAQAREYWSGKLKGELVETLLGGRIRVEKIVEEYSE